MNKINQQEHVRQLERHYRPSACRSTTPYFSERITKKDTGHVTGPSGELYRTLYQHDRDKILYSPSFRRLKLKTQIFPEQTADYLRTRLDHTLEVAQISRHLARQLGLNEDLADAIALGHDIGHTPFAHSGERALHRYLINKSQDGFKHNWQGLRVVDKLENRYLGVPGLNLTRAVRIGIVRHTKLNYSNSNSCETCTCDMMKSIDFDPESPITNIWEVQIVCLADEIAQLVHDFEDAILSDSMPLDKLLRERKEYPIIDLCVNSLQSRNIDPLSPELQLRKNQDMVLARLRSELIYRLTVDCLAVSRPGLENWENGMSLNGSNNIIKKVIEKFNKFIEKEIEFPELIILGKMKKPFMDFKEALRQKVILSERVNRMDGKADYIIHHILDIYMDKPLQAHELIFDQFKQAKGLNSIEDIRQWDRENLDSLKRDPAYIRSAVDYVAGMTDRFAIKEYDQLYSAYPRADL